MNEIKNRKEEGIKINEVRLGGVRRCISNYETERVDVVINQSQDKSSKTTIFISHSQQAALLCCVLKIAEWWLWNLRFGTDIDLMLFLFRNSWNLQKPDKNLCFEWSSPEDKISPSANYRFAEWKNVKNFRRRREVKCCANYCPRSAGSAVIKGKKAECVWKILEIHKINI